MRVFNQDSPPLFITKLTALSDPDNQLYSLSRGRSLPFLLQWATLNLLLCATISVPELKQMAGQSEQGRRAGQLINAMGK